MHRQKQRSRRVIRQVQVSRDYPWQLLRAVWEDCRAYLPQTDNEAISATLRSRDRASLLKLGEAWGLQCTPSRLEVDSIYIVRIRLLIGALVKKFQFEGDSRQRKEVAIKAVLDAKSLCSSYNTEGYRLLFIDGQPSQFLQLMQEFVGKVIGYTLPDMEQLHKWSRHGPGADLSTYKGRNSAYFKYTEWPYSVTKGATGYARRLITSDERWHGALEDSYRRRYNIPMWAILDQELFWSRVLRIVNGNRVTTVPKDSQKDRPIAIEPRLNLMLQLGVDGFIRRRLTRWGIDLDYGHEKNQYLAKQGSIRSDSDTPCTLDLKAASDSVSLRIVKLLFPSDWFSYLCCLRSPQGLMPSGHRLRYSKLSSMGNGYTFAIESLVFAACLYAAGKYTFGTWKRDDHAVFGDDLVCPASEVPLVKMLLRACGFSLNQDKSFDSSHPEVRESCGTDWIQGYPVRPVHITEYPRDMRGLYSARNRLHRWFSLHLGVGTPALDNFIRRYIPDEDLLLGPYSDEEFDGYWHDPTPGEHVSSGYYFRSIIVTPLPQKGHELAFRKLMHPLRPVIDKVFENPWGAKSHGGSVFLVTRRHKERLSISKPRYVHQWTNEYCLPAIIGYRGMR